MSDQINNNENIGNGNIMKELSDIKTSLAVNTSETQNIKETVNEVKKDIKEIKTSYITQEQHKILCDSANDHEIRIRSNEKNITQILTWGSAAIILVGILEFVIQTYIK